MTDECRPPPEHENEPWHWLLDDIGDAIPCWWVATRGRWWEPGNSDDLTPKKLGDLGWCWVAVAKPPEGV